jgi:Leucine-rich repeat (LRR) protein
MKKMKKYFYSCLVVGVFVVACSSRSIKIDPNIIIIKDSNLEKALIAKKIDSDSTVNGQIKRSDAEEVKILSIPNLQIMSLDGIEGFKSLTYLDCSLNQITNLDLSQNTLLESLDCSSNLLTNIDLSRNLNLAVFNAVNNKLKDLSILSKQLYAMNASNNLLFTVKIEDATRLSILYLSNNQLKNLNLVKNDVSIRLLRLTKLYYHFHFSIVQSLVQYFL